MHVVHKMCLDDADIRTNNQQIVVNLFGTAAAP